MIVSSGISPVNYLNLDQDNVDWHVNGSSRENRFSRPLNVFIGCLSLRFSIREAVRIDHDIFFCSFNEWPRIDVYLFIVKIVNTCSNIKVSKLLISKRCGSICIKQLPVLKSSSTRYRNTLITVIKLNICLTDNHIQGEGGGSNQALSKVPPAPPPPNTYTRMHSWTHTFRFLLQMWAAKAQISLSIRTVSQKHLMLAYTKYGCRSTLRPSIRQLSLLDTSAWPFAHTYYAINIKILCAGPYSVRHGMSSVWVCQDLNVFWWWHAVAWWWFGCLPSKHLKSDQHRPQGWGGGYSNSFLIRRLGPSIYRSPPKISGISSTPKKYLKF